MDHSQHSIHNHEHHLLALDTGTPHDHAAAMLSTTTVSPLDVMGHGGHEPMSDQHAMHHSHDHGTMNMEGAMHHMMSMAFHFGYNETVLFSWWKFDSIMGLIGSMIAIFVMAVLYEGLKYYREYLFWKTYNLLEYRPVTGPQRNPEDPQRSTPSTSASPVQYVGEVIHKQPPTMLSLNHFYQTGLHILQVTLSFMLMLIFMTYNVWLCIAVVLGAAVGYFLFCWRKSVIVDVTEHCH
ncbi:PREDICTED: high affinity copper uptake protein 1 isoform X1 [Bactrocera latifrons]|uniref:Copper transport protein n=2 Tax=Bactrocera latifrons TaxID=174628 RepID=A0A0K8V246_BACLA|nr:PREDICTED: high affinity copper uptake protein 1 isoform X1 [Bactrocera latifrons]XP_018804234.1 PREDICTED: high affinity copper uptake protein 1 isoform X1 [Bactrocera latifrons]